MTMSKDRQARSNKEPRKQKNPEKKAKNSGPKYLRQGEVLQPAKLGSERSRRKP
jgi:hypothetical protein